jgi:FMN phosphatase YigB (HAD superfamily)
MNDDASVAGDIAFLLDVDNTLLDNDRVHDDLSDYLERELGMAGRDRYWAILGALHDKLGYADYLGALQRYRLGAMNDLRLLLTSSFLLDYPFADRLFPGALDAIKYLRAFGLTIILSDGDAVFQPRKIQRSGLWAVVEGRVLIYVHKEQMLREIEQRFPARHYVVVDDKPRILTQMKRLWGARLTSVFVRQGRYAYDACNTEQHPVADVTIERIGDLPRCELFASLGGNVHFTG